MVLNTLDESNRIVLVKYMLVNFWKKQKQSHSAVLRKRAAKHFSFQ